jgi:hypothetical protein
MLQRPIRYLLSVTEHGSFTRAAAIAAILEIVRLAGLATILPEAMAREQSGLCVVRRKSPIDPRGAALLPRLGGLPRWRRNMPGRWGSEVGAKPLLCIRNDRHDSLTTDPALMAATWTT